MAIPRFLPASPTSRPPIVGEFFIVEITGGTAPNYEWKEVHDDGSGSLVEVTEGAARRGTAENPGVDVLGTEFEVGEHALCRAARGNSGLTWELFALADAIELTAETEDGSTSVTPTTTLQFDQDAGFTLSDEGDGTALVSLTGTISCDDFKTVCEGGRLRRYRCNDAGEYVYDTDLGPCEEPEIPPPPPVPPVPPVPPTVPPPRVVPVVVDLVTKVCVRRGNLVKVSADYAAEWIDTVIHVNTAAGGHTITLPDPASDPLGAAGAGTTGVTVKRIGANAPAIASASGSIDGTTFVSIGTDYGWETFHHDGTHWFSGVAWPVVDVLQERARMLVRAPGFVSDPECVTSDDCCTDPDPEDPVDAGGECCPDGAEGILAFTADAAAASLGGQALFEGSLVVDNGGASWSTSAPVFGSGEAPGADTASIQLTLYCVGGAWTIEGTLVSAAEVPYSFREELEDDGADLHAILALPVVGDLGLIIQHPCPTVEFVLGECVAVMCGSCTAEMSATYAIKDQFGADVDAVKLRNDLPCQWHSAIVPEPGTHWTLRYVASEAVWRLSAADGREWFLTAEEWNCCEENLMYAEGDHFDYSVAPSFDCCPPPPVTYNCVEGSCVDPGDGTGTYGTLEQCQSYCGSVTVACCEVAKVLTINMTTFGSGTATLVYNPGTSVWEGSGTFTIDVCGATTIYWELRCSGSDKNGFEIRWSCGNNTSWQAWFGVGTTSATCNPFEALFEDLSLCSGCAAPGFSLTGSF